jgi:hypothetical protein
VEHDDVTRARPGVGLGALRDEVPVGFAAVHFWLQGAIIRGGIAWRFSRRSASTRAWPAAWPLYRAEIAARYLQDGQAEVGARLGRIGDWLLPVLMRHARRLGETTGPARP